MNYKLFNAARNKSTMNYQEGRFDMEMELNIDIDSTDRCRNMRLTSCPRHSHNECVKPANLPDIHLKNAAASTSKDSKRHPTSKYEENLLQKSMRILRTRNRVCICNKRQQRRRRSERKASTTLGIIVGAFVVCWLPFFMLALIRPFYKPDDIPHSVSSLFLWLGYCNSALNPIIYAIFNKEIRKPFILIMCLRWRNLNELMREEYYHQQFGERRTRNGINGNEATENTEGANLVDHNKNIGNNNRDIDNNNQNVDNNNQNIDNSNQSDSQNNQNIGNNNQDANGNHDDNQDIGNNKQDVENKKQDIEDNNQVAVIDSAEKSEMPRF